MEERGRVIEAGDGLAKVVVMRREACSHCRACDFGRTDRVVVEAGNPVGARAGDEVVLELESARVLGAAFVAYLVPLAFMVVGLYLGGSLARAVGRPGSASLFGIGLGFALLALSYVGVHVYDKRVSPALFRAEITKVVDCARG